MHTAVPDGALLRRYAGDWRSLLPGTAAGVMQLMYPPLGQAVMEHSAFVTDPLGRIYRSIPQIWAMLLAPDGEVRGRRIRNLHRDIKGVDGEGSPYHALEPETFWWAHATFTWEIFRSVELFHPRQLTVGEAEQLYQDSVAWYRMYGMPMRPVPRDLAGFRRKFDRICAGQLEMTPAARMTLDMTRGRAGAAATSAALVRALPVVPAPAVRIGVWLAHGSGRVGLVGSLPAELRIRFPAELAWSRTDQMRFALNAAAVRQGFRAVPAGLNSATLRVLLRRVGHHTRGDRYVPQSRGSVAVGS